MKVLDGGETELDLGAERAVAVVGLGVREDSSDGLLRGVAGEAADAPGVIVAGPDVDPHGARECAAASARASLALESRVGWYVERVSRHVEWGTARTILEMMAMDKVVEVVRIEYFILYR